MIDSCQRLDAVLMAYADGEASAEERRSVEAHLQGCVRCRERLAEWQTLRGQSAAVLRRATARAWQQAPLRRSGCTEAPGARTAAVLGIVASVLAALLLPFVVARGVAPARSVAAPRAGSSHAIPSFASPPPVASAAPVRAVQTAGVFQPLVRAERTPAAAATQPAGVTPDQVAVVRQGALSLLASGREEALPTAGRAAAPRWSPTGRWLLYERVSPEQPGGTLWVAQPGTSRPAALLPEPASAGLARWSPSRDEVAVARPDGSLWLAEPPDSAPRSLLPAGGQVTNLAWERSGAQLAAERRDVDGVPQGIWLVGRDGGKRRILQDLPASPRGAPAPVPVLGPWAPTGTALAIWLSAGVPAAPTAAWPLAVWTEANGVQVLLPAVALYRDSVAWSPNGGALAAAALGAPGDRAGARLTVAPLDGSPPRVLSPPGQAVGDLAWSPDGSLIAYAAAGTDSRRLWLTTPDGREQQPLSTGPDDGYPQWSARGDRLLFVHQTPSGAELWEVARDGTDAHRVAAGLPAIGQLPSVPFGSSGLASYRGIFAWNGAAMLP